MPFRIIDRTDPEDARRYLAEQDDHVLIQDNENGIIVVDKGTIDALFDLDPATRKAAGYGHMEALFLDPKNREQLNVKTPTAIDPIVEEQPNGLDALVLHGDGNPHEIANFGNIWIRKLYFPTKDMEYPGHAHTHDHVSLLMSGSVRVEVEGYEPAIYKAPTYIVIHANHDHKVTALEDRTLWWCLHAMRDDTGEVVEVYGNENNPLSKSIGQH